MLLSFSKCESFGDFSYMWWELLYEKYIQFFFFFNRLSGIPVALKQVKHGKCLQGRRVKHKQKVNFLLKDTSRVM